MKRSSDLEGRVALVTGSTRGIGRAIAERFAREGAVVAVHGRNTSTVQECATSIGSGAHPFAAELDRPGASANLVERVLDELGRIDVLVNNAGVALDNYVTGVTDDRWDTTIAVNLTASFGAIRAVTPSMRTSGGGVILNIVSWSGERGNAGQAAYSASKAGLHALTLTGAKELGKFGIRVNSISPAVPTDMGAQMTDELRAVAARRRPLKIDGTVHDVADAAVFLASDRARFITGETLHVDGGLHLN